MWLHRAQGKQPYKPCLFRNRGCQRERDHQGHWFESPAIMLYNSIHKVLKLRRGPINTKWRVSCSLIAQGSDEEGCACFRLAVAWLSITLSASRSINPIKRLYWNITYLGLHWSNNSEFRICGPDNLADCIHVIKTTANSRTKIKG